MKASGGIVFEGVIDGNNGNNGYNTAQVALYRRSATALTNNDRPTGTLTYTFSTGRVSGASSYYNGWSQSIPETVAGTKLYVIMAVARSQENTDTIEKTEWSTPTEYVADGVNSAPVTIYKRAASVSDKPADGAVYNFKTGVLSGTLNGWSTSIPATDSKHNPCWVRHAMAVSSAETDTIGASEWSDATKLVEDGAEGKGYKAVVYRDNFTEAQWDTDPGYGVIGHVVNNWDYVRVNADATHSEEQTSVARNGSVKGDWFIVVGTATDTKHYHVATYRCTNDSGNLSGECINHQITKDGEGAIHLDIDNQSDVISCHDDGTVRFAREITTVARITKGSIQLAASVITSPTAAQCALAGKNATVTTATDGTITIKWNFTTSDKLTNSNYEVTIPVVYNGKTYNAKFTLGVTNDVSIYQLAPSLHAINFVRNDSNALTPPAISVSCGYIKITADGSSAVSAYTKAATQNIDGKYNIYYRYRNSDGTTTDWTLPTYNTTIGIQNITTYAAVEYALAPKEGINDTGSNIIDSEAVPISKEAASSFFGDITNEADLFGTDSGGVVQGNQPKTTKVHLYLGSTKQTLTANPTVSLTYATSGSAVASTVATYTSSGNGTTEGSVVVTVKDAQTVTDAIYADITASCSAGNRAMRFVLKPLKSGAAGVSPELWQLAPTHTELSFGRNADDSLTPDSIQMYVNAKKTVGSSETKYTSGLDDWRIYWGYDNEAYTGYKAIGASWNFHKTEVVDHNCVWFELRNSSDSYTDWVDRETIPIVKSGIRGIAGTSPWVANLDNQMDSISCDGYGYPVKAQSVYTTILSHEGSASKAYSISSVVRKYGSNNASSETLKVNASDYSDKGVKVAFNSTTNVLTVSYNTSAQITGKDIFVITITSGSVPRTLEFTINAIEGDVYNLLPKDKEIICDVDLISANLISDVSATQWQTTKDGNTIKTSGVNADTVFNIISKETITPGTKYVFGFYVNGWSGTGEWTWYASNNSSCMKLTINSNGWCWGYGALIPSSGSSGTTIAIDDSTRSSYPALTLSRFTLLKVDSLAYTINGSNIFPLTCGYTKRVDNNETKVEKFTETLVDSKYDIFYCVHYRGGDWTRYLKSGSNYGHKDYYRFIGADMEFAGEQRSQSSINLNVVDAVEFVLVKYGSAAWEWADEGQKVIDRQIVYVKENGGNGKGYKAIVYRNNFTESQWTTIGTIGQTTGWDNTSGTRGDCSAGDWFTVVGTATDTGYYHVATYECDNNSGNLHGKCINHQITKNGENGDDAVIYQISLAGSRFYYDPNTYTIYVNIKGKITKTVGSTISDYSFDRTSLYLYFLRTDDSTDPVPDVNNINNGYTTSGNTFATKFYNNSGYNNECAFVAELKSGGKVIARESIQMETDGQKGNKGDTGRMYYLAGKFPEKAPYTRTAKLCPVVYYSPYWWYLAADSATGSDTPSDSNSSKWKKLENYGAVLTDAIFVKQFAQFGAAIITYDWLISCHGMIGSQTYGGTVEEPDEYNGKAAYTYFDPLYPEGFNAFTLGIIQDEVNISHNTSWTKVTDFFKLTPGTYTFKITCYANSSSETVHVRLFEGDSTKDAYYLCGTTNEEATIFTKTLTIGSSRSDFNIRAAVDTTGDLGYVVAIEIIPTDTRFVPNFALDLKTGAVYQGDAHIRGTVTTIGPTSKIIIADGVIQFFGMLSFPNIVLGVDADGCAVLNFYDKAGNFKYGLGPDKIFENQSQAESMTLMYYDIDEGSYDVGGLTSAMIVTLYRYMFKNQPPASSSNLYRYLAKIVAGVYGPGTYCASGEDAQRFNRKFFRNGFSSSAKLQNSDLYGGGIVATTNRPQCGYFTRLSTFLFSTNLDDLDNCGYTVLQDSDVSMVKDGQVYRYYRNGSQIFYYDISSGIGSVGYNSGGVDAYTLNLCVDPTEGSDDVLIDPVYYFVMQYIDSNGNVNGSRTFYINKKKLSSILSNAGYSL